MNTNITATRIQRERTPSTSVATETATAQRYDELSSSGVDSDWILFSPHEGDETDMGRVCYDVLSTSNLGETDEVEEDDDDDDDDDSLIDTLGSAHAPLGLDVPIGQSLFDHASFEDDDGLGDVIEDEYITSRIERWRKEQARELINTLHRTSDVTSERLMASWGVDDRLFMENDHVDSEHDTRATQHSSNKQQKQQQQQQQQQHKTKRFYGDEHLRHYSDWEVSKIKKVALELSSSLTRDSQTKRLTAQEVVKCLKTKNRRSSVLLNLSRSVAHHCFSQYSTLDEPFWKQSLSSAHSSLSLSTNSIMFGNLSLGV
ncbi:uncharacterized protein CYBJADRAFT_169108 [Cyberlindnera jadinii NRRL Y-1542]|uniref:Uncharacterized protein n=1 Tax=Cyberlindnera jadinii (strain ATCC 18201 / CBS 1600 / BCRC 20928 / JCM 3617 / NBRC 0987 / NRRL Y-1542) TaxID=983966 RepID=A0A1E4RWS8_CYBJN|nr:hypothetical protein CYBJADRAFT_169108 [Cyberlindnera jadinii NRRL Y-1542]ODV71742.1 hypothetical protein CYBJADRAFT_169108 [Cyberlindnera jadinii NRRL Y-1542]